MIHDWVTGGATDMDKPVKIGMIGDFNPSSRFHLATNESLAHAARALGVTVDSSWLSTESLDVAANEKTLQQFDGLWCSPGSPYKSMNGALKAIRFAREKGWPFIGT
jgi:CTP synthase (UTP-ammonia lyase)